MSTLVNNLVRISHVPGCTPGTWVVSLRGTVLCKDCDDNQPNGECLEGPFATLEEVYALYEEYTYWGGDLYPVYDDLTGSGYYLYDLNGEQSPAFQA